MEREIKFRFWDIKEFLFIPWESINSEYLYDYLSKDEGIVIPQQYTGLKDKNGVEVYEGDVVKHFDHSELIREVIFMKGSFGYWTGEEFISYASNYHFEWLDLHKSEKIEVIGNIHENPELLDPR